MSPDLQKQTMLVVVRSHFSAITPRRAQSQSCDPANCQSQQVEGEDAPFTIHDGNYDPCAATSAFCSDPRSAVMRVSFVYVHTSSCKVGLAEQRINEESGP